MLKKGILIAVTFIVILSGIVVAEEEQGTGTQPSQENVPEGYTKISDRKFTTIFNNEDLKAIFGIDPVAVGGKLLLRYGRTGAERNLGYVYGTIVADVKYKKLTMTNSGFISYEQPNANAGEGASTGRQEESVSGAGGAAPEETERREIKITGERLLLNSANPVRLAILIGNGVYSQHDYSAVCNGGCQLVAVIEPDTAYLNITGKAVIVKTEFLDEYNEGKEVDKKWIAGVENTNRMSINNAQYLGISVKGGKGTIEDIEFSSDVPTVGFDRWPVLDSYYDSIITSYEGNTKVTLPEGKALGIKIFAGGVTDIAVKGRSPGYATLSFKDKADVFILGTKDVYNKCARKVMSNQEEKNMFFNSACIFIDSLAGEIDVKPRRFLNPLYLTIKLPALNVFNMLSMEQFEETDIESYVEFGKAGGSTTLVFRRGDINAYTRGSLSPGLPEMIIPSGAWYELGASFSAYAYDLTLKSFNHFECNIQTRECFLDGDKVMGFEQQRAGVCRRDADCGEGKICRCVGKEDGCAAKRCVTKQSCSRIEGVGTRGGSIDVLFAADGYDNEAEFISDVKRVVNNGLLSVEPFSLSSYRNKFEFYSMFGATLPSMNYGGVLAPDFGFGQALSKQCPRADTAIVLSQKSFRAFANFGGNSHIPMPILNELGGELVVVHEFGHSFGDLRDEYFRQGVEGLAHTGFNCLETNGDALNLWTKLVGEDRAKQIIAEDHRGCGGDCFSSCIAFFRPSANSIMNDLSKDDGKNFNDVSKELLKDKLDGFA